MTKISWKPGNMIYPLPAVIVTCGSDESEYNAITIAWTGTVCTNPPMTYISVRPERHSYAIIKKNGGFIINLTTEEMVKATDYIGVRSGANEDKLAAMNLSYSIGEVVKAPVLTASPVSIECLVKEVMELGSHHMFLAEVVNVQVDDRYMDEANKFHLDQSKLIAYSHGRYFGLGEYLGKFGYSVEKQDAKKKMINRTNNKSKSSKR